jgi:hypothetical protein
LRLWHGHGGNTGGTDGSLQERGVNGRSGRMMLDDGITHDFERQLLIEQSKNEAIRVRLAEVCDIARDLVNYVQASRDVDGVVSDYAEQMRKALAMT